jgi:hypothetical protein
MMTKWLFENMQINAFKIIKKQFMFSASYIKSLFVVIAFAEFECWNILFKIDLW